jgi:hypothetical protein
MLVYLLQGNLSNLLVDERHPHFWVKEEFMAFAPVGIGNFDEESLSHIFDDKLITKAFKHYCEPLLSAPRVSNRMAITSSVHQKCGRASMLRSTLHLPCFRQRKSALSAANGLNRC